MIKYLFISLLLHLLLFVGFRDLKKGDETLTKRVKVSFIVKKTTSPNPGSKVVADQEQKEIKKSVPQVKKKVEKKKVEKKKQIKSKIADKKKKPEKKKEEPKEIPQEAVKQLEVAKDNNDSAKVKNDAKGEGQGVFTGSNFMADGDGGYIALSSAGINYEIINEVEPEYPSQAEAIGYSKKVVVSVKFLVGLKGNIEKVQIIKSHSKLGFDREVKKAIERWRFKPIIHHGKNIKVYFVKDFIFNPR